MMAAAAAALPLLDQMETVQTVALEAQEQPLAFLDRPLLTPAAVVGGVVLLLAAQAALVVVALDQAEPQQQEPLTQVAAVGLEAQQLRAAPAS